MEKLNINISKKDNFIIIKSDNMEIVNVYSKILRFKKYDKVNNCFIVPMSYPSINYLYKFISAVHKLKNSNVVFEDDIIESSLIMAEKIKMSHAIKPINENIKIPVPENLKLYDFQKAGVEYIEKNKGNVLIADEMGTGKMSDVNSNILTPHGWVTFGKIEIGDSVIGSDGKKCNVTGVYPQGEQDAYRITFSDSTQHVCGLEHLWGVHTKNGYEVLDTRFIIDNGLYNDNDSPNFFMPIVQPIEFRHRELDYDIYRQGFNLGSNMKDKDIFIPFKSLFNSVGYRISLLQGLLDANSKICQTNKYNIVFKHKSLSMIDNVIELVRSLGGVSWELPILGQKRNHYYEIAIVLPMKIMPFRIKNKQKQYYNCIHIHKPIKYIKRIDYIGKRRMQCVSVDSKDHLYVIDSYNITHNTIQTCAWINIKKKSKMPCLVVCPKSASYNWKKEIEKWVVGDKTIKVIEAKNKHKLDFGYDFYIINYELVDKIKDFLNKLKIKTIILDEIHYCKNGSAKRTQSVMKLAEDIKYKICLTGTPIPNRPIEAFTVLKLLEPSIFSNRHDYGVFYCGAKRGFGGRWEYKGHSNSKELQELLRSTVMIRRLKEDVLKELPDKIRSFVPIQENFTEEYKMLENETIEIAKDYIKLNEDQKKENDQEMKKQIKKIIKNSSNIIFSNIQKLRQEVFNIKRKYIIQAIKDTVLENNEPVVVFLYHRSSFNEVTTELTKCGINVSGFTGEHESEYRFKQVEDFQNGKSDVFITTLGAGSEIITLTRSSHVIIGEMNWIPAKLIQAEDRCFRIGQKKSVNIYYFLLENSVDTHMARIVEDKFKSISAILDVNVKDESDIEMFDKLIMSYSSSIKGEN